MMSKKIVFVLLLAAVYSSVFAQKKTILFLHTFNHGFLNLENGLYKNEIGQPFNITKFKYYIGDITFFTQNNKSVRTKKYFLIDESDSTSKKLVINLPRAKYDSISFIIGVDSANNCNGAHDGALDPLNGMFWTWKTGYIFLKLEGNSATSLLQNHLIEYHIGGYKAANNCIKKITLPIEDGDVKINVDLAKLFSASTVIDFTKLPSVTDNNNALQIANNYEKMFSIIMK